MAIRLKYLVVTLLLMVALGVTFERRAYAYIDPGSGLLVFQSIGAIVSGTLFYFRRRLRALFGRSPKVEPSVADPR